MTEQQKILLVQLYANGDCLYATTVARQIKNDFPYAHLTWAVASSSQSMVNNNPDVDEILVIENVRKDDAADFRKFKKAVYNKEYGSFSKIIITQVLDNNLAKYDGSIRSSIFRSYPGKITVPIQPVINLYPEEINNAKAFANLYQLANFKSVILFECAPQSKQSILTFQMAVKIAEKITASGECAVILSSANKVNVNHPGIIDGSVLSIRETAAITHFCCLLLGSSSGITWITTSTAAKQLPMIQLLNTESIISNPVSRDFKRFGINDEKIIEITNFTVDLVAECVLKAIENFSEAKAKYNNPPPFKFNSTKNIVYNLLCYLQFTAIIEHIKINREVHGNKSQFYQEVAKGFLIFPFKLIKNFFTKKLKAKI